MSPTYPLGNRVLCHAVQTADASRARAQSSLIDAAHLAAVKNLAHEHGFGNRMAVGGVGAVGGGSGGGVDALGGSAVGARDDKSVILSDSVGGKRGLRYRGGDEEEDGEPTGEFLPASARDHMQQLGGAGSIAGATGVAEVLADALEYAVALVRGGTVVALRQYACGMSERLLAGSGVVCGQEGVDELLDREAARALCHGADARRGGPWARPPPLRGGRKPSLCAPLWPVRSNPVSCSLAVAPASV